MTLDEKIERAKEVISFAALMARKSVVMCSFGKDSMALLYLTQQAGFNFPIIFHKEPFFPKKLEFANRVIQDLNLTVYDFPPTGTGVTKKGAMIEIVNLYRNSNGLTWLPTGIVETDEEPFLCGLNDLLMKPVGDIQFPWDMVFIGHKDSDVDPIMGNVLIKDYLAQGLCFPIKDFTDEDIWALTLRDGIPYNRARYDAANGFKEREDRTYNNDWHPACTRCIDRDNPPEVFCPKLRRTIPNVSARTYYIEPPKLAYFKER